MNHLVYVVLDSVRYDSVAKGRVPNIKKLGTVEKRYSFASWTTPSHMVYLMGIPPHLSKRRTLAAGFYKKALAEWRSRTGAAQDLSLKFLPEMSLPKALKSIGYSTRAIVSLPVLNPAMLLNKNFDSYVMMPKYDQFDKMIARLKFKGSKPVFYFLNVGNTHYPYGAKSASLPHLSGVHGAMRAQVSPVEFESEQSKEDAFPFSASALKKLKKLQQDSLERTDSLIRRLYKKCPPGTHIIITSDHGELFGEDGYFGHGPVMHPKVFEVPFVEGKRP